GLLVMAILRGIPTTCSVSFFGPQFSRPNVSPVGVVKRQRFTWTHPLATVNTFMNSVSHSRETMCPQLAKSDGDAASTPADVMSTELAGVDWVAVRAHAKMESSLVFFMISCCRRLKAWSLSP